MRKAADGTEFVVAAIPLGGYVRMLDEREGPVPDELRSEAFNNKGVWQRIAIVAAGPIVNLLFAVLAYSLIFAMGTTVIKPVIGSIQPDSLAEQAGLEPEIEIVEIDGRNIQSWQEVNLALAARIGESGLINFRAGDPNAGWVRDYGVMLDDWRVDLEAESPLSAFGVTPWRPTYEPVLGQILANGAADRSGLEAGDRILYADERAIDDWNQLVEVIKASPNQPIEFVVLRNGVESRIRVTPDAREVDSEIQGYLGVGVQAAAWPEDSLRNLSQNPLAALVSGVEKTWQMVTLTLESIWKMIVGSISVKNLSGPITIAKVAGDSASSGLEDFISFLAYLSVSLGVLNLLPIPMLDGGHLVYYFVELVRGKPVSEKVQVFGLKIGMALLFSLMSLAIINDLARL